VGASNAYTLTPSWDTAHAQTKLLGSSFDFAAPVSSVGASIDAAYTLVGKLKTEGGMSVDGSIGLKFLGIDGKVLGFDMPAIFPDGPDSGTEKEHYLSDSLTEMLQYSHNFANPSFDIANFDVAYQSGHTAYALDLV